MKELSNTETELKKSVAYKKNFKIWKQLPERKLKNND